MFSVGIDAAKGKAKMAAKVAAMNKFLIIYTLEPQKLTQLN